MKKTLKVAVCVGLCCCLLTGCTTFSNFKNAFFGSDNANKETEEISTVKIGVFEPISGKDKDKGNLEVMGVQLAHELYPEVMGKPVELIMADNQSEMDAAETAIQELVAQKPAVIIGSYGETLTLIAGDAVKANNIPAISVTSTNPLITVNNQYYFCATYAEERQGAVLADFAITDLGLKKTATVRVAGDDVATANAKRFNSRVSALTGDNSALGGNFVLDPAATDYTETLKKLKETGAQAVFMPTSTSTAESFMKQADDMQMSNLLFLGPSTWNDEGFLKKIQNGKLFNVAFPADFVSTNKTTNTEMSEEFINAYKAKYGASSEPSQETAVAFDAYLIALEAIETAYKNVSTEDVELLVSQAATEAEGKAIREDYNATMATGIPQGKAIRDALMNINDFVGASGVISYGGGNEAQKNVEVQYYKKGVLVKNNVAVSDMVQKEINQQQTEQASGEGTEATEATGEE